MTRGDCTVYREECAESEETTGESRVPLISSRPLTLCEPGLVADTSNAPESMSSNTDRAVSKLLFMVVAITPVGPVFSQPLQYRPGRKDGFTDFFFQFKSFRLLSVLYVLSTCSFLNTAQVVWDDGFVGVKWHRWIDGDTLVANTANDQATGHILHFSCEHCPRSLT